MREIGISPRFSRDKFVPLQTKQRYSTRDISGEVSLTLFFRGFVPFLSLADFVSRNKNLQVADLQRLKSCFGELVTATTSNHQNSTYWLRDGSFLKLKSLEFGYSMKYLRFYVNGTNLLTFSNFKLWDPEMGGNGYYQYPTQRVFNIGIQFNFN